MTFDNTAGTWAIHDENVARLVDRLMLRGFSHGGHYSDVDPNPAFNSIRDHTFIISPLRRSHHDLGVMPRDLIIRVKDGQPATVKLFASDSGKSSSALFRSFAYLMNDEHRNLHLVSGIRRMPRGFLSACPQEPFDVRNPEGLRMEWEFIRELENL